MPKKQKAIDLEDDAKYFTVYRPYPFDAAWVIEEHCIKCVLWIATCIGTIDPIFALHHRPGSDSMVVIEIDKAFKADEKLLGEHSWSKFLAKATRADTIRVSQIFYSHYNSCDGLRKDGWHRVEVPEQWRQIWQPNNAAIRTPYPPTEWCAVPQVNMVGKNICRPLPTKLMKPELKPTASVPGSTAWTVKHAPPGLDNPVQPPPQSSQGPVSPKLTSPKKQEVIKPKTLSLTTPARAPLKQTAATTNVKPPPAWSGLGMGAKAAINTSQSSAFPSLPTTGPKATTTASAWKTSVPSNIKSPYIVPPAPGASTTASPPTGIAASRTKAAGSTTVDTVADDMARLYAADSDDSDGSKYIPVPTSKPKTVKAAGKKGRARNADPVSDDDDDDWDGWNIPAKDVGEREDVVDVSHSGEGDPETENLWAGSNQDQADQQKKPVCPEHGLACGGKGICLVLSNHVKKLQREQAQEADGAEGKAAKENSGWQKPKKKKRAAAKNKFVQESQKVDGEHVRGGADDLEVQVAPVPEYDDPDDGVF